MPVSKVLGDTKSEQIETMEEQENIRINMFRDSPWPGKVLSNFAETPFELDGVKCKCSESFIQSLKVKNRNDQKAFCLLSGLEAWEKGSELTKSIFITGKIWWCGIPYILHSPEHFELVRRGLLAKFLQSPEAKDALLATENAKLVHDYGQALGKKQSLPVDVFCKIVTEIRSVLVSEKNA